jgi:hypothetical protein
MGLLVICRQNTELVHGCIACLSCYCFGGTALRRCNLAHAADLWAKPELVHIREFSTLKVSRHSGSTLGSFVCCVACAYIILPCTVHLGTILMV